MHVEASTPCRIDLAGGTLDIYPLYLFMEGGVTLNIAVDLLSVVQIEGRSDHRIHLRSDDTGAELTADSADALPVDQGLSLVARAVKFYRPETGVDVTTRNSTPQGSGLGSSSALLMALSGALREFNHADLSNQRLIDNAANLEAQVIRIPTGKQDYYPAMYGAVNAIWFGVEGDRVEPLIVHESGLSELEQRLVLSFTGESRFSGVTNWSMMRAYIDGRAETVESLDAIKETAVSMRDALVAGDHGRFAQLIDEEWQNRKRLAKGVTTSRIDRLVERARKAGARASKVCGAGGGGCMITVVEPGGRTAVEKALQEDGAQVLPFHIARRGLTVMRDSEG